MIAVVSDEELLKLPRGNWQEKMEHIVDGLDGKRPRLLLHACCAPCSSFCLESLLPHFDITVYFYNPNITGAEEYERRKTEILRFVKEFGTDTGYPAAVRTEAHDTAAFFEAVRGYEDVPEGGLRCVKCFRLRLNRSAELAASEGFDYFTTTLTISPLKNAAVLNALGEEIGREKGVAFLPSDFKKKNGFFRSTELSRQYGLYRQDYCGCVFSKRERQKKTEEDI